MPSLAGSIGFWPPRGTRLPPTRTMPDRAGRTARARRSCLRHRSRSAASASAPAAPPRDRQPSVGEVSRDRSPRSGWRGTMIVSMPAKPPSERCMRGRDHRLLAWMGARGDQQGPVGDGLRMAATPASARAVAERRTSGFRHPDTTGAEHVKRSRPPRSGRGTADPAEECADAARHLAPAREGTRRHPRIDEDHRDAAARRFDECRRPQFRFGEDRGVRPPMVEEAPDVAGHVEGDELWSAPGGMRSVATLAEVTVPEVMRTQRPCSRDGSASGRIVTVSPTLAPCIQTRRPSAAARRDDATALADAGGILLALGETPGEDQGRQRRNGRRRRRRRRAGGAGSAAVIAVPFCSKRRPTIA